MIHIQICTLDVPVVAPERLGVQAVGCVPDEGPSYFLSPLRDLGQVGRKRWGKTM